MGPLTPLVFTSYLSLFKLTRARSSRRSVNTVLVTHLWNSRFPASATSMTKSVHGYPHHDNTAGQHAQCAARRRHLIAHRFE